MAILPPKITIVVELKPGNAAETLWKILEECHALDAAAEERIAAEPHQEDPEYRYQECPVCGSGIPDVRARNAAGEPCTADWHPANRAPAPELREDLVTRGKVAAGVRAVLHLWHVDPRNRDRDEMVNDLTEAVMARLGRDAPGD